MNVARASDRFHGRRVEAPPKAIVTPFIDALCCGGLSILVIFGFFIFAQTLPPGTFTDVDTLDLGLFQHMLILHALLNWPHFIASYRLLYQSREQVLRHRWESTYVPVILSSVIIYGLLTPQRGTSESQWANGAAVELLNGATMFLLAWHYTGQAWGMTASFAYIAGIKITRSERFLILLGNRALLIWHLLWALDHYHLCNAVEASFPGFRSLIHSIYLGWGGVALLSLVPGVIGFARIWQRTGQVPPLRAILPWVALYFWYTLIFLYPLAVLILQISHALQYIPFVLRVEANQYAKKKRPSYAGELLHVALYYVALVVIGVIYHMAPQYAYHLGDTDLQLYALVAYFVILHHYFIDGAIWKIRNPKVQKDLFSHLQAT